MISKTYIVAFIICFIGKIIMLKVSRCQYILKPYYIGIKTLFYFTIFDQWGKKIFYTSDMNKGWDGNLQGQLNQSGSFSWILKAVDQVGKIYELQGSFVLIK